MDKELLSKIIMTLAKEVVQLENKVERLTKKNERLREALQDIARQPEGDEDSAQAVAKAALRQEV